MNLKTITKKVVSYCDIPEDMQKPKFIEEAERGSHVECHLDEEEDDELSLWLSKTFPELKNEESFFIHIDY